ncbi:copper amine oxidase N-terminal domain-containing protein [Paenibacillus lautus]|uniref:copper amine oxidase N-terminal domain-containing protein n=1 Tax=Paenibacillus lautus TaxID=1401 RepID=UPI001BD02EDD|nr:copper amine oxidase N-terminal domain-containing protein [Paenibacillus lautus]
MPTTSTATKSASPKSSAAAAPQSVRIHQRAGRRMLIQFALASLIVALLVGCMTFVLDPFQFYRKATWYAPIFTSEQRYQNPGLARNYPYDTIILGTSMTENFLPSEVGKAMGGQVLKLSMRGSTADEQYKIASLALQTGKVKTVLWGLDYFALKNPDEGADDYFPEYLYDDIWWNDYKYWFNYSAYENFARGIVKTLMGGTPQNIENLYNWHNEVSYGNDQVMNAYDRARNTEYYFSVNEEPIEQVQHHFNTYVLSLVEAYPDVEFIVYYPPYSILRQKLWQDTNPARYSNQLEMKTWMFQQLNRHGNTQVYDFQAEADWTYDFSQFKDLSHHSQDINSRITQAVSLQDARYKMTPENAATFMERLTKQVDTVLIVGKEARSVEVRIAENGEPVHFTSRKMPDETELMVPVKEAVKALGISAAYDAGKITLSDQSSVAELTVDSTKAWGWSSKEDRKKEAAAAEITLRHAPYISEGKTMIPLLQTAELLGYQVDVKKLDHYTLQFVLEGPAS